ncbi:MAG: hypothetical protein ACJAT2_003753 [Bacteriovoracaceae bacterium]|jgi:hypothetical protein
MTLLKHRLVVLLFLFLPRLLYAGPDDYDSHITSKGLNSLKEQAEFDKAYSKRLDLLLENRTEKTETTSIDHQKEILRGVQGRTKLELESIGFSYPSFKRGVIDSDLGKLNEFKKLLYIKSKKSDHLLSFLKGEGSEKSKAVLKKVLDRYPSQKRYVLNPALTNDHLRKVFKKYIVLQHYLHELPGIADSLHYFDLGILGEDEFIKELKTNLFHNGPHAGFWKFFSEETLPSMIGSDKLVRTFFLNTPYEGEKIKGGFIPPSYPGPLSLEGYIHVAFDRLSQGTRGGVSKIFEEIRKYKGQSDVEKMSSLLFDNPRSTQEQISMLIDLATEDLNLNDQQRIKLIQILERIKKRLRSYISFVTENIEFKIEGQLPVLKIKKNEKEMTVFKSSAKLLSITKISGASVSEPRILDDPMAFGDELKEEIMNALKKEEALNGAPFLEITE